MDPVHFSGKEVIEMGIRIEENGENFYAEAAARTTNETLVALFEYLAREEIKHKGYFKSLKKELTDEEIPGVFNPHLEEAVLYIKALSDSEVFKPADQVANLDEILSDELKAVDFAIRMEKDSILFYHELANTVRESDKAIVEKLIKEEKEHLRKLTEFQTSDSASTF